MTKTIIKNPFDFIKDHLFPPKKEPSENPLEVKIKEISSTPIVTLEFNKYFAHGFDI
jgi:hypothetical protein